MGNAYRCNFSPFPLFNFTTFAIVSLYQLWIIETCILGTYTAREFRQRYFQHYKKKDGSKQWSLLKRCNLTFSQNMHFLEKSSDFEDGCKVNKKENIDHIHSMNAFRKAWPISPISFFIKMIVHLKLVQCNVFLQMFNIFWAKILFDKWSSTSYMKFLKKSSGSTEEVDFKYPYNDLMLWAVLTRRHKMLIIFANKSKKNWFRAKFFWEYGEEAMAKALTVGFITLSNFKITNVFHFDQ